MNRKVSIIIPVIRPASARRCVEAIKQNAGVSMDQYEIVDSVDTDGVGCPEMVKMLTKRAQHDLVMFLGDDTIPGKDFLKIALEKMHELPGGWGVVGLNSGGNPIAHWLAHKDMLAHIEGGSFFPTDYIHCWCDDELKEIAEELGRFVYAEDAFVEHYHPIFDTADWDDGYLKAYSNENTLADHKTFFRRKRARNEKKHGTRIAIAQPLTFEMVYSHFHFSMLNVVASFVAKNRDISVDLLTPDFPGQIDAIRNNLVEQALLCGSTHIIMMDTDQVYCDVDMIEKMLAHNRPVVGARVHRRYPPFDPLLLRGDVGMHYVVGDDDIKPDGEFCNSVSVDATGCGCVLYDTSIFIDMWPPPWFELRTKPDGKGIGEDIWFCSKLKAAGIDIIVDCTIDIKHLTLLAADWGTYRLYKKLLKKEGEVK